MTVRQYSTGGFDLVPYLAVSLAFVLTAALASVAESGPFAAEVPESSTAIGAAEAVAPDTELATEAVAPPAPAEDAASDMDSAAEAVAPSAEAADDEAIDEAMDEPIDEPMDEPIDEAVDEAIDEAVDEAIDEAMDEAIDEAIDEAMDEAIDEAMDEEDANSEAIDSEDAALMPPKPAEADVLNEVLSPSEVDTTIIEPPAPVAEMVGPSPGSDVAAPAPAMPAGTSEAVVEADLPAKAAPAVEPTPPELDLPPDVETAMDDFMSEGGEAQGLRFVFRYQPWEDVLQWFADQADLSLIMDAAPSGTFNYTDNRTYTPAQAIDLLNSVLLIKGYTLVRRDRMLVVINLEDGIPENLVTTIPEEELDERGEYELVSVLFQLDKFEPEEAKAEIAELIGPQGAVRVLAKTRQLFVTETAGRLRTIRRVIRRIEDPEGLLSGKLESYQFKNILPDEGLVILQQLLNIPPDANATEDDSFRFAVDLVGMRLLFSGSADKVAKAKEILTTIDVAAGAGSEGMPMAESLQLEVYPVTVADPESVLKVMQTLLEGAPGARLSIDPKTNSLVALATPSSHATIRATIDQMQAEVRRIEVIYLQRVDPQLAVISIKKMFGDASEENSTAPTVEADSSSRQLLVHGTEAQIGQIRVLLGKMGETEFADGPVSTGSRIRVLPITGQTAETALQNLRMIWPTISDNPIKEVTPSAIMPSLGPQEAIPSSVPGREPDGGRQRGPRPGLMPGLMRPPSGVPDLYRPSRESRSPAETPSEAIEDQQTARPANSRFHLAAQTEEIVEPEAAEESPSDQPQEAGADMGAPAAETADTAGVEPPLAKSPIVVSRGPNGIMIASDDVEALDEFERLINTMTGGIDPERTELRIFYLKHAKAAAVSQTLTQVIGSGTTGSSTATEDSILGQLVAGSLGSTMGSLLNLGAATLSPTGMLRITPEPRLNALIVEANAVDLRNIEAVLKLLDQPESPEEILVNPRSRLIPVYNTAADEMAATVKEIFADKMQGASGRGGGGEERRPSPEDFLAAMRGGRGGSPQRGGSSNNNAAKEEPERMTIGVDSRSNSLIVYASESLFEEVRTLVEELDMIAGTAESEATEVITLNTLNPDAMKAALIAIMGENAVSSSSPSNRSSNSRGTSSSRSNSSRSSSGQPSGGMSDDMRRRIEFMRAMQSRGGFGGGPPGGGPPGGGRPGGGR